MFWRFHPFLECPFMYGCATSVIDPISDYGPTIIASRKDYIEFISALRSVFVCPEVAGHGVERETLWVTVPVAPDFPEGPSCAHEWVVCRNTTVIV